MNEETPERPATPPVLPADDLEARTVRWPTVLGVISIVYGILALIGNGCGAASPLSTPFFLQMAGMDAEKITMSPVLLWVQVGSGLVGMAVAIVLLAGSAMWPICQLISPRTTVRACAWPAPWSAGVTGTEEEGTTVPDGCLQGANLFSGWRVTQLFRKTLKQI